MGIRGIGGSFDRRVSSSFDPGVHGNEVPTTDGAALKPNAEPSFGS